jgi:aminomethyltransferase
MVSRTGYTGETGFELYCVPAMPRRCGKTCWKQERNSASSPAGSAARDTLRLEAAMSLYGHEMDETITPLEAGLGFAVKMAKPGLSARGLAGKGKACPPKGRIKNDRKRHCPGAV